MSPITRRRIAALLLLTVPVGLWALTASWRYQLGLDARGWRTVWQVILVTPSNPWLYGSLAVGADLKLTTCAD